MFCPSVSIKAITHLLEKKYNKLKEFTVDINMVENRFISELSATRNLIIENVYLGNKR